MEEHPPRRTLTRCQPKRRKAPSQAWDLWFGKRTLRSRGPRLRERIACSLWQVSVESSGLLKSRLGLYLIAGLLSARAWRGAGVLGAFSLDDQLLHPRFHALGPALIEVRLLVLNRRVGRSPTFFYHRLDQTLPRSCLQIVANRAHHQPVGEIGRPVE